jgi:hypothetical protein
VGFGSGHVILPSSLSKRRYQTTRFRTKPWRLLQPWVQVGSARPTLKGICTGGFKVFGGSNCKPTRYPSPYRCLRFGLDSLRNVHPPNHQLVFSTFGSFFALVRTHAWVTGPSDFSYQRVDTGQRSLGNESLGVYYLGLMNTP